MNLQKIMLIRDQFLFDVLCLKQEFNKRIISKASNYFVFNL